jgi:RNA polymerase sigma factor (TIGR02999 family)
MSPLPSEPGSPVAFNDLVPLVYTELRRLAAGKMAREKPWHSLQATSLGHEVWLRLGGEVFANKAHFFAAASEAMRRILIERARRKQREKRGAVQSIWISTKWRSRCRKATRRRLSR